jgi:LacI family transcriptional regulator
MATTTIISMHPSRFSHLSIMIERLNSASRQCLTLDAMAFAIWPRFCCKSNSDHHKQHMYRRAPPQQPSLITDAQKGESMSMDPHQDAKRLSITDVAKAAGVGVGSVSRVINNAASVTPAMRMRVLDAMAGLRYTPAAPCDRPGPKHRRIPKLSHGQRVDLMVHNPVVGLGWMENQTPIYAMVFDGIERELHKRGMSLVVRPHKDATNDTEQDAVAIIRFGGDSSLTLPAPKPPSIPQVWVLGTPPIWFTGDHVTLDNFAIGRLAAIELSRMGHKKVVYVGNASPGPESPVGARVDGFVHYLAKLGGTPIPLISKDIIATDHTTNSVVKSKFFALLDSVMSQKPTAICAQVDMLVPSVYEYLEGKGMRPQLDVAVMTCNNEQRYYLGLKPLPLIVDVHAEAVGAQTVDLICKRLDGVQGPGRTIQIKPSIRDSVR